MRGSRPGERRGGRQKGTPNKCTVALEAALAEAADKITGALGADAFDGDAHALLMAVYKDAHQPIELRVAAAKAAIGFEKLRLAAIEGKVEGVLTLEQLVRASMEPRERVGAASDHCALRAIG
jgi:hypothetical protein